MQNSNSPRGIEHTTRMSLGRNLKTRTAIWLAELRAPFFTAAVVPTVLGTTMAWYQTGHIDLLLFALTLLGVVSVHDGTNVVNDYFDFKNGTDKINRNRSPFNGGSPFLVEGLLKPKEAYHAALVLFAIGGVIGIYLAFATSRAILVLGMVGIGLGYCYTSPRVNLAARGLGEIAVAAGFGPLIVGGAFAVQTETLSAAAFVAGLPIGVLIALVLFINQFPDKEADEAVGKNHWVVRLGLERSSVVYAISLAAAFVLVALLYLAGVYPSWCLIALFSALMAPRAVGIVRESYDNPRALVPAQGMTVQIHLFAGLLLSAGFFVSGLL